MLRDELKEVYVLQNQKKSAYEQLLADLQPHDPIKGSKRAVDNILRISDIQKRKLIPVFRYADHEEYYYFQSLFSIFHREEEIFSDLKEGKIAPIFVFNKLYELNKMISTEPLPKSIIKEKTDELDLESFRLTKLMFDLGYEPTDRSDPEVKKAIYRFLKAFNKPP
jgi:hypothetical protein